MSDKCLNLKDQEAKAYLQEHPGELILLDFFASWCPHCQQVGPILENIARDWHDQVTVIKIDADQSESLAEEYQVEVLPTIVVYRGGELERHEGSSDQAFFEALIKKHLPS